MIASLGNQKLSTHFNYDKTNPSRLRNTIVLNRNI